MVDYLNPEQRSQLMALISNKNTGPEMVIRRLVHRLGYRYRLHQKFLPGKPDIVFSGQRKVIFVHGCFWHRHSDMRCKLARLPKSHQSYWTPKLERNYYRDLENQRELAKNGWKTLVIWECQLKNIDSVARRIKAFLR